MWFPTERRENEKYNVWTFVLWAWRQSQQKDGLTIISNSISFSKILVEKKIWGNKFSWNVQMTKCKMQFFCVKIICTGAVWPLRMKKNIHKKDMIPSLGVLSALEWNMTRQVVGRLHMSRIIRGFMNNLAAGFYHWEKFPRICLSIFCGGSVFRGRRGNQNCPLITAVSFGEIQKQDDGAEDWIGWRGELFITEVPLAEKYAGGGGWQPSVLGCDILFLRCKLEQRLRVVRGCNKWERGLNNETKPNTLEFQF